MSWSVIATAAIVFIVGVTCSPIDISAPVTDLVPPQDDSSKLTTEFPTPATDLVPPKIDSESVWNGPTLATDLVPPNPEVPTPASDLLPPHIDNVPTPATDLLPPKTDEESTLATDLLPPPLPEKTEKKAPATLFLINVFAVKNHTAEDANDVLHNDVMKEVPDESAEPLALFLLVVEDENEGSPVSLDEVAKDLEAEGFNVERISKDGETRLVKVDLSSVEGLAPVEDKKDNIIESLEHEDNEENPIEGHGQLSKIRRKRHICLHCKLEELKQKLHKHHGGGGGCNTGCCDGGCGGGGGYYPQPVQPVYQPIEVVVVPTHQKPSHGGYYPQPQPHYPPPQQPHYPQPQPQPYCDPCQQGHGGYNQGGGGNSYAQASAQASASASSGSYGK